MKQKFCNFFLIGMIRFGYILEDTDCPPMNSIEEIISQDDSFISNYTKITPFTAMSSIGSSLLYEWSDLRGQIEDNLINYSIDIDRVAISKILPSKDTNHLERFEFIEKIGTGANSLVIKVKCKENGTLYALKKFREQSLKEFENLYIKEFSLEIYISLMLNHQNIVRSHSAFYCNKHLYLLMELSERTYFDIIKEGGLTSSQIRKQMYQLYNAIQYIEDNNIIHRDIKLENITIDGDNIRLCDFGTATFKDISIGLMNGSEPYMAPEFFEKDSSQWNLDKIDIWSFGIVYLTCLLGRYPFSVANSSSVDYIRFFMDPVKFIGNLDVDFYNLEIDFLLSTLDVDDNKRLDLNKMALHAWIKQLASL